MALRLEAAILPGSRGPAPGAERGPASVSASPNGRPRLASAFPRRRCSFAVAASSFRRSLSRCLSALSYSSAAWRAALSSILRGGCFFGFARGLFGLPLTSSLDRSVDGAACSVNGPFDPTGRSVDWRRGPVDSLVRPSVGCNTFHQYGIREEPFCHSEVMK